MKKVYRSVLERALLALLMLEEQYDVTADRLMNWVIETHYKARAGASSRNQSIQRLVKYMVDLRPNINESMEESISRLIEQLNTTESGVGGEGDLIDAMVDVLGFPFMRNVLTGKQLQELQKVILLPSELGKVTAQIKEKALKCAQCNHRFSSGEVTTVTFDGATPSLFCRKCLSPSLTVCSHCDEMINLDRSILRALKKECSCGKDHSKDPTPPPPMIDDGPPPPRTSAGQRFIQSRTRPTRSILDDSVGQGESTLTPTQMQRQRLRQWNIENAGLLQPPTPPSLINDSGVTYGTYAGINRTITPFDGGGADTMNPHLVDDLPGGN